MSEPNDDEALQPALSVYFDGACPVCRREIATYQRRSGAAAIAWVDVANCSDTMLGPDLCRADALARLHVRGADGRLDSGAAAFARLWLALPGLRWLGRIASAAPVLAILEPAYSVFLRVRRLWRPAGVASVPMGAYRIPADVLAEVRTDHAGETGAVWIYRGVLAVSRDAPLRAFAQRHLQTEQQHLAQIAQWLPRPERSLLLVGWRLAGWLTGALPAIAGARAVYQTIGAVEAFVQGHYAGQIERLAGEPHLHRLRALLVTCREDEIHHRDESAAMGGEQAGPALRAWTALVGRGSAAAVWISRRL